MISFVKDPVPYSSSRPPFSFGALVIRRMRRSRKLANDEKDSGDTDDDVLPTERPQAGPRGEPSAESKGADNEEEEEDAKAGGFSHPGSSRDGAERGVAGIAVSGVRRPDARSRQRNSSCTSSLSSCSSERGAREASVAVMRLGRGRSGVEVAVDEEKARVDENLRDEHVHDVRRNRGGIL